MYREGMNETCYSEDEVDALANHKRYCDQLEFDVVSYKTAFESIQAKDHTRVEWWQTPQAIAIFVGIAAAGGYAIGANGR